jgi:hypothetical protein
LLQKKIFITKRASLVRNRRRNRTNVNDPLLLKESLLAEPMDHQNFDSLINQLPLGVNDLINKALFHEKKLKK